MKSVSCFSCKTITETERVGFREECEKCGADLHVCKNCEFYDETAYNECKEPSADRIVEKERSNLCDFFSPSGTAGGSENKKDDLMAAAEALFKNQK